MALAADSYPVLLVDGIAEASNAFCDTNFNNNSVLYHGLQFGLEYRR